MIVAGGATVEERQLTLIGHRKRIMATWMLCKCYGKDGAIVPNGDDIVASIDADLDLVAWVFLFQSIVAGIADGFVKKLQKTRGIDHILHKLHALRFGIEDKAGHWVT